MKWWTKIRLEVLRGETSKREILRREGIDWETLKKILEYSEPPGYRRENPRPKPKVGPYLELIAQIIEEDKQFPKKQRLTGALLDRLTHNCHILEANGESYRLRQAKKRSKRMPRNQNPNR